MNLDNESLAYYSKNSVRKFYKKLMNSNLKNSSLKKTSSTSSSSVQHKNDEKFVEKKEEKKLTGDSGYDCIYCNGNDHLARDCMLKKKEEKKEKVKDEAYYAMKMKKPKEKSKNHSLVAENLNEDEGIYQIWVSRSDDNEVRHPMHG